MIGARLPAAMDCYQGGEKSCNWGILEYGADSTSGKPQGLFDVWGYLAGHATCEMVRCLGRSRIVNVNVIVR